MTLQIILVGGIYMDVKKLISTISKSPYQSLFCDGY